MSHYEKAKDEEVQVAPKKPRKAKKTNLNPGKAKKAKAPPKTVALDKNPAPTEPKEIPKLVAFSVAKIESQWFVIKLTIQGDQVLAIEMSDGDMKAIALEEFKIKVAKEFWMKEQE